MAPNASQVNEPCWSWRRRSTTIVRQVLAVVAGGSVVVVWLTVVWTWIGMVLVVAIGLAGRFLLHPLLLRWEPAA